MKIISNFSDYYDSIQQWGIDSNIVYKRIHEGGLKFSNSKRWEELFSSQIDESIIRRIDSVSATDISEPGVAKLSTILFNAAIPGIQMKTAYAVINGKIYQNFILIETSGSSCHGEIVDKHPTPEVIFDLMQEKVKNSSTNKYWANKIQQAKNAVDLVGRDDPYTIQSWLSRKRSKLTQEQVWEFHRQLGTPVFFKVAGTGIKHASLAYYGFNRLFDGSIEAMAQEISYCIGNVINNKNEPPVAISNDLKIDQHGFDRKQSFRHRK